MNNTALISCSLLLLLGAACSKKEVKLTDTSAGIERTPAAVENDGGAAGSAVDADEQAILKAVPTEEEASAKAAAEVNAENAEATLAEIRKEVGGGN